MKKKFDARRLMAVCLIMLIVSSTLLLAGCGTSSSDDKSENKQITTLEELNGRTVYAQMGTINATALVNCEKLADCEKLYATGNNDGLQKLISGKSDGYVCDNLYAQEIATKYNSLTILEETLDESDYGFIFPKNTTIKEDFNKALNKLLKNGSVDELSQKWMSIEDDNTKLLTIQNWPGEEGTWKVVVDTDNQPLSYIGSNGDVKGLDLDIILAVARELDYKVVFESRTFSEILVNVAAGNYDIGAAGVSITEDRENLVAFSDPYFSNSTVILVKKLGASGSEAESIKFTVGTALYKVFIEDERYMVLWEGVKTTIIFVLLSLFCAFSFGFLIFLWKYTGSWVANKLFKALQRFIQFVPGMVWLYIVFYIVFTGSKTNGFIAALVAFTIMFGDVVDFVLEDAVGQVNDSQREAAFAMGYSKYKALFKIYLPQAMPIFLGNIAIEMVGMVKTTCLIELVAVNDIQSAADTILAESQVPFLPLFIPAVLYAIIGIIVFKTILYFAHKAAERMEDPEAIKAKILKGRI